jgi:hypothetical protein
MSAAAWRARASAASRTSGPRSAAATTDGTGARRAAASAAVVSSRSCSLTSQTSQGRELVGMGRVLRVCACGWARMYMDAYARRRACVCMCVRVCSWQCVRVCVLPCAVPEDAQVRCILFHFGCVAVGGEGSLLLLHMHGLQQLAPVCIHGPVHVTRLDPSPTGRHAHATSAECSVTQKGNTGAPRSRTAPSP